MKFPNKYLRNLKPYKLASHKIWSVSPEQRQDILKLDWNEATCPPSPKVRSSIQQLLSEPSFFNLYPPTYNPQLMSALSRYVGLPEEYLQIFASSDALHEYICKVFISVGDPILILGPSYDNFRLTCQANGADVHFSCFAANFQFLPESFENDITTIEPAVVYICNPNNPTGYLHSVSYIEHLLVSFPDTLFLIDEAYYEFSGVSAQGLVKKYDNILISRTMSKAFALANFRVGYLIASPDNVLCVNKVRNPKNLSSFAQAAALAVLEDAEYMWSYVAEVKEGKQLFISESTKFTGYYKVFPSGGNFLLIECSSVQSKYDLMAALERNNIFVRDTTQDISLKKCFRITCGTKCQMRQVISVISSFYGNE